MLAYNFEFEGKYFILLPALLNLIEKQILRQISLLHGQRKIDSGNWHCYQNSKLYAMYALYTHDLYT